jgi:hypothetical protein
MSSLVFIKHLLRPSVEYANVVWLPNMLMLFGTCMEKLEKVLMRVIKFIKKLS